MIKSRYIFEDPPSKGKVFDANSKLQTVQTTDLDHGSHQDGRLVHQSFDQHHCSHQDSRPVHQGCPPPADRTTQNQTPHVKPHKNLMQGDNDRDDHNSLNGPDEHYDHDNGT